MGRSLKVLLIKAPEIDFTEQKISYTEILTLNSPPIPLGIASLSAYLKQRSSHQVRLLDIFAEGFDIYKERGDRRIFFDTLEFQRYRLLTINGYTISLMSQNG